MVITLIGYRGCGKSTVGPLLAARLNYSCVDSDSVVEERAGRTISEIFAIDGEDTFRDLESAVLKDLLAKDNIVVAAGGGAILRKRNRKLMRTSGPVIWLQASAETLAGRIGQDPTSGQRRPSLTGKSIQDEVDQVLENRKALYSAAATQVVNADALDPHQIVDRIVGALDADLQEGGQ